MYRVDYVGKGKEPELLTEVELTKRFPQLSLHLLNHMATTRATIIQEDGSKVMLTKVKR